jgi:ectoine hydroxylase-related dioxygenase (phytanoyl-CoA dioxygenase family)
MLPANLVRDLLRCYKPPSERQRGCCVLQSHALHGDGSAANIVARATAILSEWLAARGHRVRVRASRTRMSIIAAPPCSLAACCVHRDMELPDDGSAKQTPIWTVLVCLTDVTRHNGAVRLWRHTSDVRLDPKQPQRAVNGATSTLLTGTTGTAFVFDAYSLHLSLPNTTATERLTASWFLTGDDDGEPHVVS